MPLNQSGADPRNEVSPQYHYSVVRDVRQVNRGCILHVETPLKETHLVMVDQTADRGAAGRLRREIGRPLATKLAFAPGVAPECTALFATGSGPQRRRVDVATALALSLEGVHAIVTHG